VRNVKPIVLTYHSISPRGPGEFERKFVLPEELLRAHLEVIRRFRLPVLPLDTLLDHQPRRGVVLIFDDAYQDFGLTAWPILRTLGYPAAITVPTAHVGSCDSWNEGQAPRLRPLLDWDDLRQLHAEGVAVAAHSATHPDLTSIPPEQADWELRTSRERIEAELTTRCRVVSYPYTWATPAIADAARRAGYETALGGNRSDDTRYNRKRHDVGGASVARLVAELLGIADVVRKFKDARGRRAAAQRYVAFLTFAAYCSGLPGLGLCAAISQ
jgi:peptidoglycan/xylan/chitin deacetylase (PgdA/CDA1 family)